MARLRYNDLTATLDATGLTAAATSIGFTAALSSMSGAVPTITGSDYIPLIIDSEIVYLTAYTSGALTGTITRAQESTTASLHAAGATVENGPTVADFTPVIQCRAYASANVSLPNSTVTVIPLDSESYDTGLHDPATNNSRVTIPTDGNYLVIGTVQHQAPSGQLQTRVHKNGAQYGIAFGVGSSAGTAPTYTDVLPLVAGDYIELAAYQASGSASNVYGGATSTYLIVKRLD